jgi:galactose-1-phosphate uridylyltransferase
MENGDAVYRAVASNMECASDTDKAGKILHDYAMRKYQIDPEKIDKRFYNTYVRSPDASTKFYRAKRFAAMNKTPTEIHATMSHVMATNDPNLKVFRTIAFPR